MKRLLGLLLLFCYCSIAYSQASFQIEKALEYIKENKKTWNLTSEDISGLILSDSHVSSHNGIAHLYFQQTINGIPIYNAITNVNVSKEGKTYHVANRFIKDAAKRLIAPFQHIGEVNAIRLAAINIGIEDPQGIQVLSNIRAEEKLFAAPFSDSDIKVEQVYVEDGEGKLKLCYDLAIDHNESPDYWSMKVDQSTGKVINKMNYTLYCSHPTHASLVHRDCNPEKGTSTSGTKTTVSNFMQSASYLVYPLPLGGPNEGGQAIATDQQLLSASPFGWHDLNGIVPDFTYTRGNNVHAYEDRQKGNNSQNNEPNGGDQLEFLFNHNVDAEPNDNLDAAITNLFYTCNMAHDLFYLLGFTEVAGNFQARNFSLGGKDNDFVKAEGLDGGDTDNANFSTVPDGSNGRMQMYLFSNVPGLLKVDSPEGLSDLEFETGGADFGQALSTVNLQGELTIARTGNPEEELKGCEQFINDVNGKIALIDRGVCDFSSKAFNAQQAGAIMAIVCNIAGVEGGTAKKYLG